MSFVPTFDRARATEVGSVLAEPFKASYGSYAAWRATTESAQMRFASPRVDKILASKEARTFIRQGKPIPDGTLLLDARSTKRLSREVLKIRRLIQVSPEQEFELIHRQLLQAEKVHNIVAKGKSVSPEHIEELLANRVGSVGMDTDCQALIVPTYDGPQVLAQIFRYHAEVSHDNGRIYPDQLPHNLEIIKHNPVAPMTGKENVTGYWTISAGWPGSGPALISDLQEAAQGRFETTISPIRSHLKMLSRDSYLPAVDKCGEDFVRYNALAYLEKGLQDKKVLDGVMDFHLSNGAFIGWIHVNPDSETDWITVNYIYDREQLERNKAIYNSGVLPVSEALQSFGVNVVPIQSRRLAPEPMPQFLAA